MNSPRSIEEIREQLQKAEGDFTGYCKRLAADLFFLQPEGKWSPAQQVKHLVTSAKMTRLAFVLPKLMVRLIGGKPNRSSRKYDELVAKYHLKLEKGGKASGRYIPKPIPEAYGKEKLIRQFSHSMQQLAEALEKNWKDPQLDRYLAPHPLLGKITLRELCFFTIHHTYHHLESIKKMNPTTQ